jgi:hypothetical protein
MDLRAYYRNMRATEAALPSPIVVIASLKTPDGGVPDVLTEVPTAIAARMIMEQSARAATKEERNRFYDENRRAKQVADEIAAASKVQIVVLPSARTVAPEKPGRKD